jgi:ribosomal protein S18 acetylase RimI-like enzyme
VTDVRVEVGVDPARRDLVQRRLQEANTARSATLQRLVAAGGRDEVPLELFALAGDEVIGGLVGSTWATWLHVEYLWIDDDRRGSGLGSRLLAQAEAIARAERGCQHVRLETWSFQAPGFYAKQGYREVGRVEDHPPGHVDHLLVKDI